MTMTQSHIQGQQVDCSQVPCQSLLGAGRLLLRPSNPSLQSRPLSTACLEGWAGMQAPALTWVEPHQQEAEDQGGQEALLEGQGCEVAHSRGPQPAKQHQQ